MKGIMRVFFRTRALFLRRILIWLLLAFPAVLFSQVAFSGEISQEEGGGLAWTTISIDQGKYGTISDKDGRFTIDIPPGQHVAVFSRLGYRSQEFSFSIPCAAVTIVMKEAALTLDEVMIMPGDEDPAMAIMREAINRKKHNRRIADGYTYEAYTKSVFQFEENFSIDSLMESWPRTSQVDYDQLRSYPIFQTNILLLSETLSTVWKGKGNQEKELILSSNSAGGESEFSILGQLFNQFDPYENRVFSGEMAERGIVSPVADQALLVYDFQLLGRMLDNGQTIYKIAVRPRRKSDAAFRGMIQIADGSFAIQSLDLWCTKEQAIQIADSIHVTQAYQQVNDKWAPLTTTVHVGISFDMVIAQLPVSGTVTSIMSGYELEKAIDPNFFTNEVIAIADTSAKQSDLWWQTHRALPLSKREARTYDLNDSLRKVKSHPEYLDSLTRNQPGPNLLSCYTGYRWVNHRENSVWHWGGIWSSGFNAIEGWFLDTDLAYRRSFKDDWTIGTKGTVRGAAKARRLHLVGEVFGEWSGRQPGRIFVMSGDYPRQFSSFSQISPFANTYASLSHHRSHVRLYRQRFVSAGAEWSPSPGLEISLNGLAERRTALSNTSEFSIRFQDRVYEPNFSIPAHDAALVEIDLSFTPGMKFISLPDQRIALGSAWPELGIRITQAIPVSVSSPNYTKLILSLSDKVSLGALGRLSYTVSGGRFLRQEQHYFPDVFHFLGGETFFRKNDDYRVFALMPYYAYSSDAPYIEVHAEQAFGMVGIAKVPGLRNLKLSEYGGIHGLLMQGRSPYLELNYGLEARIFKVLKLRLDVHVFLLGEERWLPYAFTYQPQSLIGQ